MKIKNYLFFVFLLLISVISFGKNTNAQEILLTDNGVILNLRGIFKMDWDKSDPDVPCSSIGYGRMMFYPENKDIAHNKIIVLMPNDFTFYNQDMNWDYEKEFAENEKAKIEILKKIFPEEVKKMEKIQKGELQSPARVKIKKVTPYTECDFTTVYAQVIELKKIEGAKPKITKLKVKKLDESGDFDDPNPDEFGYLEEYRVNAKDGYANMREKPTTDSKVISKLDNEIIVRYITKYGDWYYVYYADYPSDYKNDPTVKEYRGFIHKSQLEKRVY